MDSLAKDWKDSSLHFLGENRRPCAPCISGGGNTSVLFILMSPRLVLSPVLGPEHSPHRLTGLDWVELGKNSNVFSPDDNSGGFFCIPFCSCFVRMPRSMHVFIHPSVHRSIHPFVHSFIHSFFKLHLGVYQILEGTEGYASVGPDFGKFTLKRARALFSGLCSLPEGPAESEPGRWNCTGLSSVPACAPQSLSRSRKVTNCGCKLALALILAYSKHSIFFQTEFRAFDWSLNHLPRQSLSPV